MNRSECADATHRGSTHLRMCCVPHAAPRNALGGGGIQTKKKLATLTENIAGTDGRRAVRGATLAVLSRREEPAQLARAACDAAAAQVCAGLDCEDGDEDAFGAALRWALDALASGDAALAWRDEPRLLTRL